jgi:hypothetical protein
MNPNGITVVIVIVVSISISVIRNFLNRRGRRRRHQGRPSRSNDTFVVFANTTTSFLHDSLRRSQFLIFLQGGIVNPFQFDIGSDGSQFFKEFLPIALIVFPTHAEIKIRRQCKGHEEWIGPAVRDGTNNDIGVQVSNFLKDREQAWIQVSFGRVVAFHFPGLQDGLDDGFRNGFS